MATNDILKSAWQRFGAFSQASDRNQKRFIRLRRAILIAGVLVTALALLGAKEAPTWHWLTQIQPGLRPAAFVLSVLISGLFGVAAKFDFGAAWVVSRSSAELIKREIFLFRTGKGVYDLAAGQESQAPARLAEQLRAVGKEAADIAGVGPMHGSEFPPYIETERDERGRTRRDAQGKSIPMSLSSGNSDDGLVSLSATDYKKMRIRDQIGWYERRAGHWRSWLNFHRVVVILAGLVGSAFAFFGGRWTAWIAVTTVVAAALASWMELRRLEPTVLAYRRAASDLSDILLWWDALSPDEQSAKATFAKLVSETEAVLQSENASWTLEMRKRVADLKADAEKRAAAKATG